MTDPESCHDEKFQRLVDDVVVGELSPAKWRTLQAHLLGCPGCRARYNRAVLAERMLQGGPAAIGVPSGAELDRIAEAVLPRERSALWQRVTQWIAAPSHSPLRWSAAGLVTAAAAVALFFPVLRGAPPRANDEFATRGGPGPGELYATDVSGKKLARSAGLRAFCLQGTEVRALDPASGPTSGLAPRCEQSAQLKLAVSNPGHFSRVFLVGLDAEHDPKWYAPRPPEFESVPAPAAGELGDVPVGASVRLGVNHRPGPVRIYALFSDRPVTTREVEEALLQLAPQRGLSDAALPLKRSDVLQRSLLIDVE